MWCYAIYLTHLSIVQQIATLASLYTYHQKDYVYPKEKIDSLWEKVLLIQYECLQNACEVLKMTNILFYSP